MWDVNVCKGKSFILNPDGLQPSPMIVMNVFYEPFGYGEQTLADQLLLFSWIIKINLISNP